MSSEDRKTGGVSTVPAPRRVPQKRPGQKGGKRDENRKARIKSLTQGALGLMLAQGIESVTVDEIVKTAGMAKGSFYRYFEGKPELIEAIVEPLALSLRRTLADAENNINRAENEAALLMAYAAMGAGLQQTLATFPREILLYLQECRAPRTEARAAVRDLADELAAGAVTLTDTARERGLLKGVASRVSALTVVGAVERMLFEVLSGGDLGANPQQVAITLITLIMDGLRADSPT